MKGAFITFTLALFLNSAYGQVCQEIEIAPDSIRKQILKDFIAECYQNRYFFEDKGIINLVVYQDGKGRLNWVLSAMIDDRYKENPTNKYSLLYERFILVYQADSSGRTSAITPSSKHLVNDCMENIILDRVYQQPVGKDRFVDIPTMNGTSKKIKVRTINYGNQWNSKRIIFDSKKTYRILIGV